MLIAPLIILASCKSDRLFVCLLVFLFFVFFFFWQKYAADHEDTSMSVKLTLVQLCLAQGYWSPFFRILSFYSSSSPVSVLSLTVLYNSRPSNIVSYVF